MKTGRLHPTPELYIAINNVRMMITEKPLDVLNLLRHLKEVMETLIEEEAPSSYTEVDKLFVDLVVSHDDEGWPKIPDRLHDVLTAGMTLVNWPTNTGLSLSSPHEMLDDIKDLISQCARA
jgi:hypothetical protein